MMVKICFNTPSIFLGIHIKRNLLSEIGILMVFDTKLALMAVKNKFQIVPLKIENKIDFVSKYRYINRSFPVAVSDEGFDSIKNTTC